MASDKHRSTRRDILAWIRKSHSWHTPLFWTDSKSAEPGKRHVEIECSCGKTVACEATADQMAKINVGFRDVPRKKS